MMINTDSPRLSIIVPIHSGLKSFDNIMKWISGVPRGGATEVIAVFDGKNEDLRMLISNEARTGRPIRMLDVNCGNPGEARNLGMEVAKGEWITFWDSDDIGELDVLVREIENAENQTELIIGCAEIIYLGKIGRVLKSDLREVAFNPGIWRFLFRRESLTGVSFPALNSGEDQVFLARYGYLERNLKFSKQIFYRYFIGSEFQLTRNKEKIRDAKLAAKLVEETSFSKRGWKNGYAIMSARLLTSYLRRGPGNPIERFKSSTRVILSFHDASFIFCIVSTWFVSNSKGI